MRRIIGKWRCGRGEPPPRPPRSPWGPPGAGAAAHGAGGGAGGGALAMPKWYPRDREEGRPEPGRALGWVISVTPPITHPGRSLECVPSPWQRLPGSAHPFSTDFSCK